MRGLLIAPPYLFLCVVFWGECEIDSIIWPAGLTVFLVGVGLRIWAQTHIHYRLRVRKVLTMTGPYAFIRNPIYLGNIFMMGGATILSELVWFLPIMLVWCIGVYTVVVCREEMHLSEKYGEPYLLYLKTVPRWFPRLRRSVQTSRIPGWQCYVVPSLIAEAHCLLFLPPLIVKEWL